MRKKTSRREFLTGAGGLAATVLAGCFDAAGDEATSGWPSYGYDAGNTGYNPETSGPISPAEVAFGFDVEVAWRHELDRSVDGPPVIGDERAFWSVGGNSSADRDLLYAVDAATGDRDWTIELDDSHLGTPVVADGTVYLCTNSTLSAFDAEDGSERWSRELRAVTSPVLHGGNLYVYGHDMRQRDGAGANVYPLYEIDTGSGDHEVIQEYVAQTGTERSALSFSRSIAVVENTLVAHTGPDLRAVDLDSGTERWVFEREGFAWPFIRPPVGADGTVYTGGPGLCALDVESGEKRWQYPDDPDVSHENPAVGSETAYVTSGGALYAVDAETGDERWSAEFPWTVPGGVLPEKPTVADGIVYVIADQKLWAVGAEEGRTLLAYDIEDRFVADPEFVFTPVVAGDLLYVAAREDDRYFVYAFDAV